MVDRISELPDGVLSHILSFLPTVNSVATCILSRRWKYVWRNTSNLSFDDSLPQFNVDELKISRNSKFANFVNSALGLHNPSNLEKFQLYSFGHCSPYDVSRWISDAIMRRMQSLYITRRYGTPVLLPCNVFTCNTLEVLQLKGRILVDIPSMGCLPKLTTMTLDGVMYQDDKSPCKLISSCTSLESLVVEGYKYHIFSIFSSSLRDIKLSFIELPYDTLCNPEIVCPALQRFHISNTSKQIISFPINLFTCKALEKVVVEGYLSICATQTIYLPNLTMLELWDYSENDEIYSKLISLCTSLERLLIMRSYSSITISSLAVRDLTISLLSCSTPEHKLVVDAPVVRSLRLTITGCVDCHIEKFSSLEEAEIEFRCHMDIHFDCYSSAIGNILQAIQNVKILTLTLYPFEVLVPENLPEFHRLTKLLVYTNRRGMGMFQEFIRKSPKLEYLTFREPIDRDSDKLDNNEIYWRNPSRIPACLLSSLRGMLIIFSSGSEDVISMAKYILENARILSLMKICFSDCIENNMKMEFCRNLLQVRCGSENCELLMV